MLEVKDLTCGYGKYITAEGINLKFDLGEVVCLFGANGVGKTTFFKSLLGLIKSLKGEILLNGKSICSLTKKEMAKEIAYVPQAHNVPFDFSVFDVILMGRTVHLEGSVPSQLDKEIVNKILRELNIEYLKDKSFTKISGGERQMVLIARALVQETKIIVLDEPTSNLDYGNQVKIINQVKKLHQKNMLVIMTTHSPNQVFNCATKVVVFKDKKVYAIGKPEEVITDTLIHNVYDVRAKIHHLLEEEMKFCVPCIGSI